MGNVPQAILYSVHKPFYCFGFGTQTLWFVLQTVVVKGSSFAAGLDHSSQFKRPFTSMAKLRPIVALLSDFFIFFIVSFLLSVFLLVFIEKYIFFVCLLLLLYWGDSFKYLYGTNDNDYWFAQEWIIGTFKIICRAYIYFLCDITWNS